MSHIKTSLWRLFPKLGLNELVFPHTQPMRAAVWLLLSLFLITASLAQEFKGVTYKAPAGWEEATDGGARVFAPKGLKEGAILAIILTGVVPSNGSSWEKQFSDTIALANEGGKASDPSKIEKREKSGVTLLIQSIKLDLAPIGKHSRLYAQVSQADKRVFVTVLINDDSLLEKHGEAVSEFLGSIGFKSAEAVKGKIPIGDTPDLFPGSVGWLPSGRGVAIPTPTIIDGKPVGLWWRYRYDPTDGKTKSVIQIYLSGGIRASNPRLGGGMLYDVEGQRAQKGNTGVGSFSIAAGQIVEKYDGFQNRAAFATGSDKSGKFFKIGTATFRPLTAVTSQAILGQWKGSGIEYKFKADGTYESGMAYSNGDWAIGSLTGGTYIVDGYLIMLVPKGAPSFINILGKAGDELIIGSAFYSKR